MSLYSAIQFATVSFLYTTASNLGDFQVGFSFQYIRGITDHRSFSFYSSTLLLYYQSRSLVSLTIPTASYHSKMRSLFLFQVGWTAPYPVLSRKRPTADLVSRKVLTPLLGQIIVCVIVQLIAYKSVQSQPW